MKSLLTKKFFIGVLLGVLAGVGGTALAGRCAFSAFRNPEKRINWMVSRLTNKLDLNENQQNGLENIKKEVTARFAEIKTFHERVPQEIISQIEAGTVDETRLNAFFDEENVKIVETRKFLIQKFSQFHSTLTAEQKKKLEEEIRKFFERRKHWQE